MWSRLGMCTWFECWLGAGPSHVCPSVYPTAHAHIWAYTHTHTVTGEGREMSSFWARSQLTVAKMHLLASPCLSVRPYITTQETMNGFSWNLIFVGFTKSYRRVQILFKIRPVSLHKDPLAFLRAEVTGRGIPSPTAARATTHPWLLTSLAPFANVLSSNPGEGSRMCICALPNLFFFTSRAM
jgi:hypothetical protein